MFDKSASRVFGATMLIAGTSIGAAMLAMPIMTGLFGFFGTVLIMLLCWAVMYWMSLVILEASLQFADGTSFVSMSQKVLGRAGVTTTWITFLLLFYALVAAYLSGSGKIIIDMLDHMFALSIPQSLDILPLLLFFAPLIYLGLGMVDAVNRWLMVGMILSYVVIVFWLVPRIDTENLALIDWRFSLLSFSVVVTSFGYHVIIPTITTYLHRDIKKIRICLLYGSLIPLVIYLLWELIILGTLPIQGSNGLAHAYIHDVPLSRILRIQMQSDAVAYCAQAFSIFAIVTSFLGVAQGLFDFLKDGLHIQNSLTKKNLAFVLTFLPPILLVLFFESSFIVLLEYAGALVSVILGIIPILIVWQLRARNAQAPYVACGGKLSLIFGILFFVFVIAIVLLKNAGLISFVV